MIRLLYDDKLAPITSTLGFLKCDAETAATTFYRWETVICPQPRRCVEMGNITSGSLEDIVKHLLPLTSCAHTRYLFVPTRGQWTAYFDNGWCGSDPSSVVSYLAEQIGCLGVRAAWVPNTLRNRKGRLGSVVFEVYDKPNPILNIRRSVYLVNEGNWTNNWDFGTSGEPFPFEQTERYQAKRKTDRFTPEMLDTYLKEFGIDAFSEDFYVATKENPAKLVSMKGKFSRNVKKYSLRAARKNYI